MSNPVEVLLKTYGAASLTSIALKHEVADDNETFDELSARLRDKKARRKVIDDLPDTVRGFAAFMDQIGRRLRGERLKKRWFLHGYDDFDDVIQPLVDVGVVVVGNTRAREPVALETVLEQGITQHWVQITPGFEELMGEPPEQRKVVEKVADETTLELQRRMLVVEFNLLNLARFAEQKSIRLNRDGSAHRSDLKALADCLVDRPGSNGPDATPDPMVVAGWDVIVIVLSLAESLGLITRRGDLLKAVPEATSYFLKPLEERLQILLRAAEQQRIWNELHAVAWYAAGETPATGNGDGAVPEEDDTSAAMAGPRGSVIAALRRLNPQDWFDVEDTIKTIATLESRYLTSALPAQIGGESINSEFVRAVITILLPHIGAIEIGRGSSGAQRARLTAEGRAMLGIEDAPEEPNGRGAILVEPNFEVTCFLDMANLRLLFDLSRCAELARTSERVIRYRLQGESAQWGYARGYTADGVVEILSDFSAAPIPPAVKFALQDWERLHRRVTVFLNGSLIASTGKADPEVVQSGIIFAIDDKDSCEAVDPIHTFVVAGFDDEIDRSLRANKPVFIDYDGEVRPALSWFDDERVTAPIGATDLRTLARLETIALPDEGETFRIAPDKVRSAYGEEGYRAVIELLRSGLADGLSAEREIALKSLLGRPADGRIISMDVLMVSSDEDGDRVARVESIQGHIQQRLGPKAFEVKTGKVDKLANALRGLGIAVET